MILHLDGVKEQLFMNQSHVVECPNATWTYKYSNGYVVVLRGHLRANLTLSQSRSEGNHGSLLKIGYLQFEANTHDKLISTDAIIGTRREESPQTPRLNHRLPPSQNGATRIEDEDKKQDEGGRMYISQASIPAEPVNAFGIPQATMRCLEVSRFLICSLSKSMGDKLETQCQLAESVAQMSDLMVYAFDKGLGPKGMLFCFSHFLVVTERI